MTAPTIVVPAGAQLPPLAAQVQAAERTRTARSGDHTLQVTAALYAGDQWAKGGGWAGPMPLEDPRQDAGRVIGEIERVFVSRNLLRDIVQRHQSGVAGREPLYSVAPRRRIAKGQEPTGAEQVRITEYTDALTSWWDDSGVWLAVQQCLRTALWSGKGTVRLFIHKRNIVNGMVPKEALAQTVGRISVHAPAWNQTGVLRDADGHVVGAYHQWKDSANQELWELHERVDGQTVVHPNVAGGGTDLAPPNTFPVSDLLIFEVNLEPLVTDSIVRLQKLANKALTMLSRNADVGGFVETTILNAQMPGKWVQDKDAPGGRRFEAAPFNKGPGVVNFLNGVAVMQPDPNNPKNLVPSGQFSTPSVIYRDPVAVTTFTDSFDAAREAIFDEAKQLHVLISGDATASGVSRQQAVNDFVSSLEPTRIALEQLVRWVLGTVLQLGLYFAGRAGEADAYRVATQARLTAVQPTAEDITGALALYKAGATSEEDFLGRIGVEDVDAMRATRKAEGVTPVLAFQLAAAGIPMFLVMRALRAAGFDFITDEMIADQQAADQAGGAEPPVPDPEREPDPEPEPAPAD